MFLFLFQKHHPGEKYVHQDDRPPSLQESSCSFGSHRYRKNGDGETYKAILHSLPLNDHCLNFRANSGNSHTSRKLVMKISASTRYIDQLWLVIQLGLLTTSEPQNSALAGVGTPMKEVVWRSSRLNFASLRAEKAAMMKATYGNQGAKAPETPDTPLQRVVRIRWWRVLRQRSHRRQASPAPCR